ncbi:MAG: hypothetical protein ACRETH_04895, partial [Steroidobacteraceae bacterium]
SKTVIPRLKLLGQGSCMDQHAGQPRSKRISDEERQQSFTSGHDRYGASRSPSQALHLVFHDRKINIAVAAGPPVFSATYLRETVDRRQFASAAATSESNALQKI